MLPLVPGELVRAGELAAAVSPGAREGLLPGVGPRVGLHRYSQLVVSSGVPAAGGAPNYMATTNWWSAG